MVDLPRYVIAKRLSKGAISFYFNVPVSFRKRGCQIHNEPLGVDYGAMVGRARTLNGLVDEWLDAQRGLPVTGTTDALTWQAVLGLPLQAVDWQTRK